MSFDASPRRCDIGSDPIVSILSRRRGDAEKDMTEIASTQGKALCAFA